MSEYFEYLRLMLEAFFKDFGIFFKDVFASPWDKVGSNVSHYNELFATYSANFGFWGWYTFHTHISSSICNPFLLVKDIITQVIRLARPNLVNIKKEVIIHFF